MLRSLFIKLGMWGATVVVVFWIGWSATTSIEDQQKARPPVLAVTGGDRVPEEPVAQAEEPVGVSPSTDSAPAVSATGPQPSGKVDLNLATAKEFESLPGIGPALAERIVAYRASKGRFRMIGDLRMVKGIGRKKFERVRALVIVTPIATGLRGGKQAT
jgi:competence protein ComEA